MLTELPEADAKGEIAEIYAEIRHAYATPYVSSIHRHLATFPGVLEWTWDIVSPAFRAGVAQTTGWDIASRFALAPLSPIPRDVLGVWGLSDGDVATARSIAKSFTRVSPLNLVYGAILKEVALGKPVGGGKPLADTPWQPPAMLPDGPSMVDSAKLEGHERAVLQRFLSGSGNTAFVPGLYRMLAHWPSLIAHYAVELGPRFKSAEKTERAREILSAIDEAAVDIRLALPGTKRPSPSPEVAAHLVKMIDGYRVTSPEMILFGKLIGDSLPG